MQIKNYICKCGCKEFYPTRNKDKLEIYCCICGKMLKVANKEEHDIILNYLKEMFIK